MEDTLPKKYVVTAWNILRRRRDFMTVADQFFSTYQSAMKLINEIERETFKCTNSGSSGVVNLSGYESVKVQEVDIT